MGEKLRLSELGDLRSGFQLRSAAKHDPGGDVALIQLGDIREGQVVHEQLTRMNVSRARDKDLLQPADVLLRGRGANYGAAVIPMLDVPTVAVAPIYVWRPQRSGLFKTRVFVKPEFIAWFINRPSIQALLAAQAHGTYIPTVGIQAFGAVEIPVLPLDEQDRIIEVDRLLREERNLSAQLLSTRERLADALLDTYIRGRG